jgi:hypothetical protein
MKIISGGQTGADQAGWRVALAYNIPTGGWMPKGFMTEEGPRPEFATWYNAKEIPFDSYKLRTEANVREADITFWFGDPKTSGGKATLRACSSLGRSYLIVPVNGALKPTHAVVRLHTDKRLRTINIAGNRGSKAPGIGSWVEYFMGEVRGKLP